MPQTIDRSADFIVTSATQSEETIKKLLGDEGFEVETSTEIFGASATDEVPAEPEAAEAEAPAAEETPAPEATTEEVTEPVPAPQNTEEAAAPPVDEVPSSAETTEQAGERKPRNSRERKIVKLEAQLQEVKTEREKDREAREKLERELADLKSRLEKPAEPSKKDETVTPPAEPEKAPEPKTAEPDPDLVEAPKPKLADFYEQDDPNEAYLDALSEWRENEKARKVRLAEKAEERKAEESRKQEEDRKRSEAEKVQQEQVAKANEEYADALKAVRERHSDFDSVLAQNGDRKLLSEPMRYAIWTNANPEILYWLGQNPDEAERIAAETTLPEKATQRDIDRVMRKVHRYLDQIDEKIQAALAAPKDDAVEEDDEDLDDDEPEVVEEAPKSATPATTPAVEKKVAPPPRVEASPAPPEPKAEEPKPAEKTAASAKKKHTPVTPVGSRGGANQRALTELARTSDPNALKELRDIPLEDYRKQRGM